jgi:hypothetical protein
MWTCKKRPTGESAPWFLQSWSSQFHGALAGWSFVVEEDISPGATIVDSLQEAGSLLAVTNGERMRLCRVAWWKVSSLSTKRHDKVVCTDA